MHASSQPHPPMSSSEPRRGLAPLGPSASRRGDRRWHRALWLGVATAVGIHLAVLLFFRTTRVAPPSPFGAAGPNLGDVRAAAGGAGDQGLEAVAIRIQTAPPADPVPVVPVPVPVPEVVVEPEPQPVEVEERGPVTPPASAPGTGGAGEGGQAAAGGAAGTATGTGRGGGGDAETGRSGLVAPVPRGMILPPSDRPRAARGREITVWVFVSERGSVVADSTRLEPPTGDRRYDQRLKRSASEWVFEPARRAGRAVGAWYPYQIIL